MKKIIFLFIFCFSIFFIYNNVLAEADSTGTGCQSDGTCKLVDPLGYNNSPTAVQQLIGRVIKAALGVVGSIALAMFIWGGFLWMTAHGDSGQVTKGKDTMLWATLGLIVIFSAYTIVNFVIKGITG